MQNPQDFLLKLIDIPVWDKAQWQAAATIVDASHTQPPVLALVFKNERAAKDIFAGFRSFVGNSDDDNLIRVSIIEGTFHRNVNAYMVHISPNSDTIFEHCGVPKPTESEPHVIVGRTNIMTPQKPSPSLAMFKVSFPRFNQFWFAPAVFEGGGLKPLMELGIVKKHILFRRKEDVPEFDADFPALQGK